MATDYWSSSHYKRWTVDRATSIRARSEDLQYVDDPELIGLLGILFGNVISKLCCKLTLRQRVIATASVFFRRFYLKNSYCETDPFIVIAACCYVAAKAEESPVHIKNVVSESRNVFGEYGIKNFSTDNTKLAEMEFYLVDDLGCDLTVFHPYRTLMSLVWNLAKAPPEPPEAGELGVGVEDALNLWGTGLGRIAVPYGSIQMAWFIINDTYRSDICLIYPPHLIAIAALYFSCVLHPFARSHYSKWLAHQSPNNTPPATQADTSSAPTRRSSRHSNASSAKEAAAQGTAADEYAQSLRKHGPACHDYVGWFASLNVNMQLITTIAQDLLSFYSLSERLKDELSTSTPFRPSAPQSRGRTQGSSSRGGSRHSTPGGSEGSDSAKSAAGSEVTAAFLVQLLVKMRAQREADLAHPASGRPVAVNKMLERAQAAG